MLDASQDATDLNIGDPQCLQRSSVGHSDQIITVTNPSAMTPAFY